MIAALLACALFQDAHPIPNRTWDDFPVFVWRQRYRGRELPQGLIAPFGGTNVLRDEEATWVREKGYVFYVENAAGRNDLHLDADERWKERVEAWIATGDERLLAREPCLSDPSTIARLESMLERTLRARGGDQGLGVSLGDEVSVTPGGDPFDFCRAQHCEARWRAYAKEHGWPERSPTTDETRLALAEGDASLVGPWLARRRFHREELVALLGRLADRARAISPATRIGLMGVNAPTAFGGVDLWRVLERLDFVEVYPTLDTVEVLAAAEARSPKRRWRTAATIFLEEETPDGAAWQAWRHWLRGADALVLWDDAALEESPALRTRLAATVGRIREIVQRFPDADPRGDLRAALVHDPDSTAISFLQDALLDGPTWPNRRASFQREHGTRERKIDAWLRVFEESGLECASAPLDACSERGFDVLVLVDVRVIDPSDLELLQRILERGSLLVVDGELGWIDRRGRPWSEEPLQELERRFPEQVLRSAAGAQLLNEALERAGVKRLRPSFRGDAQWLVTLRATERGIFLGAALPNCATPAERARLRPVRLEMDPPAGYELTWLYPQSPSSTSSHKEPPLLPAGDAAVFVLEKDP